MLVSMTNELVIRYAPHICFDRNEPFFPIRVGWTVFRENGASPSFKRKIVFRDASVALVIEYAIYWDFDIEHLYELEHIWVFVDTKGDVRDCEGSFHGDYLRALLKDRSNVEDGTHVRVYSQPGKHAFLPAAAFFDLLPYEHLYAPAWEGAGSGGLLVPDFLEGRLHADDAVNARVRSYMARFRFVPSLVFERHDMPEGIFLPWAELREQIPGLVRARLAEMDTAPAP
jgi:hypothetical protein